MKAIRIIPVILLFANLCFSQTGWYQVNSGTSSDLSSICFINMNTGFISGASGTLLLTNNNGVSWQRINLNDTGYVLRKIYFKDENTGYILANSNIAYPPIDTLHSRVYKTTDAGLHWSIELSKVYDVFLNSIEFTGGVGYLSGGLYSVGPSRFFKSTNDGASWMEIQLPFDGANLAKKFINSNTGFLGVMNHIYKTTNGGYNWSSVYQNSGSYSNVIRDIYFINSSVGFAAGGYTLDTNQKNRFIIKTTDGGNTWNYLLNDNTGFMISSLNVINENILYAGGSLITSIFPYRTGFIIKSSNGGITWENETIPSSTSLSDLENSNLKGFAVGLNGTIYKKDNLVSVTQISTVVPSSINLHQNYPNPFNPTTTINFDIPKQSFVLLKVFDMSGKEVQNLFQGIKAPGSYQVKFDGMNLNSGVYFYKLMTDGASITKSMVLVK